MSRCTHLVRTGCLLMLVMLAGTAAADQIYRSVDADGNVTFSNQPPANAVTVDEVSVQQGPSDAARREARERIRQQEAAATDMSEARASRARQQPESGSGVSEPAGREEPVNQYYGYPYPNTSRRDKVRDRLQRRPAQRPARPVRLPTRPVPR